ncbi:MAG: polysaccharide deacetylase family protein [Spirochaetales bacterium]|nr:polysaccharide deacetylase family protein [Spirochaetales bacterium]
MQLDLLPTSVITRNPSESMRILINHELLIIKKLLKKLPHNRTSLGKVYLKSRQQLYLLDLIAKNLNSNGKAVHLLEAGELKQKILPLAAYLINFSPRIGSEEHKSFIRSNPALLYTLWQKTSLDPRPEQTYTEEDALPARRSEHRSEMKHESNVRNKLVHPQPQSQKHSPVRKKPPLKKKPNQKQYPSFFWGISALALIILFMSYFTFAALKTTAATLAPAFSLNSQDYAATDPQSGQEQYLPLEGETVAGLYLTEPNVNFNNKLVLTLDDIALNDNIDPILLTLSTYGIKAVFFVEASRLVDENNTPYRTSQELLHKIIFYGHTIGNHSFGHPNYNMILKPARVADNLAMAEAVIDDVLGFHYNIRYVRPPYGNRGVNNIVDQIVKQRNQLLILWQIDSYDWKMNLGYSDNRHLSSQQVISKTLSKIKSSTGGVILLHGFQYINSVLEPLIEQARKLRNKQGGFTFVPMEELLALKYNQE